MSWTSRIAALTLTLAMAMLAPASALGDGDPASDVLLGTNVYYPYNPRVSAILQRLLNAETAQAGRAHFPLKVALISSRVDLGAIPGLFDKPQQYADFLDQEISFNRKRLLLVVMPNGYGVAGLSRSAAKAAMALKKPTGSASDALAHAAITAVPKLAAAGGHPISAVTHAPSVPRTGSGNSSPTWLIVVVVVVAVTTIGAIIYVRRRRVE